MEIATAIIFFFTAGIAIAGAVGVILCKEILHSIICAFFTFTSVGLLFFALEQPYLAITQIVLFGVGLTILVTFAHAMIKKETISNITKSPRLFAAAAGLFIIFSLLVMFLRFSTPDTSISNMNSIVMPTNESISVELYTSYAAPFIFSSVLFLAAILGFGVIFAKHYGGKK